MEILSLAYYVTGGNKICTWEEQKSISEDNAIYFVVLGSRLYNLSVFPV